MTIPQRFLLTAALITTIGSTALAREWTDSTGKFKTEAQLVKVEEGVVFLKKESDGATIQVPIDRLCSTDQAYLKTLRQPGAELAASTTEQAFPLKTANCLGMIVLDPRPVFAQEAMSLPPLKDLIEKGVEAAGVDFRKLDRVTVFLLEPNLQGTAASKQTNAVALAEFSTTVDPSSMLEKIPADFEKTTVAGKTCHKPNVAPNPWVCVIDEKTLAFAADEESLARVLTATSDNEELAAQLQAVDARNEIRYVADLAAIKDTLAQMKTVVSQQPGGGAKVFEVIEKIDSFAFTTDLDGDPSIELLIQVSEGASPADLEKAIKDGLAKMPEMMEAAREAAPQEGPQAGGMNPQMMTQMLGGMAGKLDEALLFEQQEAALKISVKFPSDAPPLAQSLAQLGGLFAMMSQQSGSGSPFGSSQ